MSSFLFFTFTCGRRFVKRLNYVESQQLDSGDRWRAATASDVNSIDCNRRVCCNRGHLRREPQWLRRRPRRKVELKEITEAVEIHPRERTQSGEWSYSGSARRDHRERKWIQTRLLLLPLLDCVRKCFLLQRQLRATNTQRKKRADLEQETIEGVSQCIRCETAESVESAVHFMGFRRGASGTLLKQHGFFCGGQTVRPPGHSIELSNQHSCGAGVLPA